METETVLQNQDTAPKQRHIPKKKFHEDSVQRQICYYLKLQYPNVIFRSDLDSGRSKESNFEKHRMRAMQSSRAWPDLFIYEPREVTQKDGSTKFYYGMALEIKRDGFRLKVTKGSRKGHLVSDPHVQEQYLMLKELVRKGYYANFACGFDEAQKLIDWYFGKPTNSALF